MATTTITRPDRPSELLKYVREQLGGISQAELGRRLGISQPSINRIEKGNQPLTGDTAVALILLGIDAELVLPLRGMCGYLGEDDDGDYTPPPAVALVAAAA